VALAFGALFLALVALNLAAPLWSRDVAHSGPLDNRVSEQVEVHGATSCRPTRWASWTFRPCWP
jgi:peptide/nickel transport system permease protein